MSITNEQIKTDWQPGDAIAVTMDSDGDVVSGDGDGSDGGDGGDGDGGDGGGDGADGDGSDG